MNVAHILVSSYHTAHVFSHFPISLYLSSLASVMIVSRFPSRLIALAVPTYPSSTVLLDVSLCHPLISYPFHIVDHYLFLSARFSLSPPALPSLPSYYSLAFFPLSLSFSTSSL